MEKQTVQEQICDTLEGKNVYKCGHTTSGVIIMEDNELSMSEWMLWAYSDGVFGTKEKCFDCYIDEEKKK